jgi:hypothetical protein
MDLPYDDSGVLVEARGLPSDNINHAVYNLLAEEHAICMKVIKLGSGYSLSEEPIRKVTRDFKREVHRVYSKGIISFRNMYNYKDNRHSVNEITAGIHISFTNPRTIINYGKGKGLSEQITVNQFFDFISYVKALDKAFKDEIKKAKRNPGFYEIKNDLRVEYRSLPCDANPMKIIDVINSVKL